MAGHQAVPPSGESPLTPWQPVTLALATCPASPDGVRACAAPGALGVCSGRRSGTTGTSAPSRRGPTTRPCASYTNGGRSSSGLATSCARASEHLGRLPCQHCWGSDEPRGTWEGPFVSKFADFPLWKAPAAACCGLKRLVGLSGVPLLGHGWAMHCTPLSSMPLPLLLLLQLILVPAPPC